MLWFKILVVVGAAAGIAPILLTILHRDRHNIRKQEINERRSKLAAEAEQRIRETNRLQPLAKQKKTVVQRLLDKFKERNEEALKKLKGKCIAAGWRDKDMPLKLIGSSIGLTIGFGVLLFLWVQAPALAVKPLGTRFLIVVCGTAFAGYVPFLLLANAAQKRVQAIQRGFPDALDLIVICVEAGLSAEAAFNRVAEEMLSSAPEIADEFALVSAEMAFLPDRKQAFSNMAERMTDLPSFKSLATTMLQSEKYGTPLANGLRVLSQEGRDSRMAAAEKKAASLPAKLTVPMIVFFLPVLFVIIAAPAAIKIASGSH
jgi:tight adherence protein C